MNSKSLLTFYVSSHFIAAQPMWQLNDQISRIASNMSCPTGRGQLDCLRKKSGTDLQKVLLATGTQFQPVTDNVTIWKECALEILLLCSRCSTTYIFISYVAQTKAGHTPKVPLLIGTNKVRHFFLWLFVTFISHIFKDEGTLIVEGEPTAYLSDIVQYR